MTNWRTIKQAFIDSPPQPPTLVWDSRQGPAVRLPDGRYVAKWTTVAQNELGYRKYIAGMPR